MTETDQPTNRHAAMAQAQKLAIIFGQTLRAAGYHGPVAVAGGFVRDIAMQREPKDLDIFLDGNTVGGIEGLEKCGHRIVDRIGPARVKRILPCYGSWAKDIDLVLKIEIDFPSSEDQPFFYLEGTPIPKSLDIVVLGKKALAEAGFEHRLVNDAHTQTTFLKAVLDRVDIRLNAIGATQSVKHCTPHWDHDVYHGRLVIQHARKDDPPERIARRLERMVTGKFADYTIGYETSADGEEISPRPVQGAPAEGGTAGEEPSAGRPCRFRSLLGHRDGRAPSGPHEGALHRD